MRPPLGLGALARVVDQERVDQRDGPEGGVGAAGGGHPEVLAGQPLQVAVLAHVHDGVGAELAVQPAVRGQVVVRGSKIRIVVDSDRVLPAPKPRGGCTIITTFPACRVAATISPC